MISDELLSAFGGFWVRRLGAQFERGVVNNSNPRQVVGNHEANQSKN